LIDLKKHELPTSGIKQWGFIGKPKVSPAGKLSIG